MGGGKHVHRFLGLGLPAFLDLGPSKQVHALDYVYATVTFLGLTRAADTPVWGRGNYNIRLPYAFAGAMMKLFLTLADGSRLSSLSLRVVKGKSGTTQTVTLFCFDRRVKFRNRAGGE